jgi:hypothetical protein
VTETLQLPYGYAVTTVEPTVTTSDWRQGISQRRARGPFMPRRWSVRWDGVALGARLYLEKLFAGVQGDVIVWVPPNTDAGEIKVRVATLTTTMMTAQNHTVTMELEEAIEPC